MTGTNAVDDYDPIAKYVFLTQIVNAALQPGENSTASALRPIQNFVDDMYSSFLNARIREPLDHKIPPLISFVDWLPSNIYNLPSERKPPMPGVLEIDQMKALLKPDLAAGFAAGSMLLPPGYKNRPLLWGVLGHEVGGHYVLTSDPKDKLINELQGMIFIAMSELYTEKPFDVVAPLWVQNSRLVNRRARQSGRRGDCDRQPAENRVGDAARTLDETYRLIDTTLNIVIIRLGEISLFATDDDFLAKPFCVFDAPPMK